MITVVQLYVVQQLIECRVMLETTSGIRGATTVSVNYPGLALRNQVIDFTNHPSISEGQQS